MDLVSATLLFHAWGGDSLEMVKCEWCDAKLRRDEDAYEHAITRYKGKDEMELDHWKCEVERCGRRFKRRKQWQGRKNSY